MFGKLLPRETSFFDFFEQHAALTVEGVKKFSSMVRGGGNLPAQAKYIKEIEHEADVITHRCNEALHKTFITPLDRDDIHRLISRMDDIIDSIEAASEKLVMYEVREIRSETVELADVVVRACELLFEALKGLRDKKVVKEVPNKLIEINRLENEGDAIHRQALVRLFKEEKDAIEVIKWKEILQYLEDAADRCEDVADIIEGMILEKI